MKKVIRPQHTAEVNLIILLGIFLIACVCSYELFDVRFHNREHLENSYPGIVLIGIAVVIMTLIVWEEILFKIKLKQVQGGIIFRIRRKKLKTQVLLYTALPIIFTFIYLEYDVKMSHFIIWAIVCMVIPAIEIIVSWANHYHRYLELTKRMIRYRNNKKDGSFNTEDIKNITIVKDTRTNDLNKIQLVFTNNDQVTIDLDEMHLHDFHHSIYTFMKMNYKHLLTETNAAA